MSPKVRNIAECANIAEFSCQKTFGDIPPLYTFIFGVPVFVKNMNAREFINNPCF